MPLDIFNEIRTIEKYKNFNREDFDQCLDFCISGGYALKKYNQWHRLIQTSNGAVKLRDPRIANRLRMNAGTIQDSDTLKVRYKSKRGKSKGSTIGEVEEAFAVSLTPGDTFLIGGRIVKFESLREMVVEVSPRPEKKPKIAVFSGTKFSTSTLLCDRILRTLEEKRWDNLPEYLCRWLEHQASFSELPQSNSVLIETFPRNMGNKKALIVDSSDLRLSFFFLNSLKNFDTKCTPSEFANVSKIMGIEELMILKKKRSDPLKYTIQPINPAITISD